MTKIDEVLKKHKVNRNNVPCGVEISDGWANLLDDLLTEILAINLNYVNDIGQLKEKFGGIRCYLDYNGDADEEFEKYKKANEIIRKYEKLSFTVCENCGDKGKVRDDIGWMLTLCDEHYKKRKEEIKQSFKEYKLK